MFNGVQNPPDRITELEKAKAALDRVLSLLDDAYEVKTRDYGLLAVVNADELRDAITGES